MKPSTAIARARKRHRLEAQQEQDGSTCWMVLDETNGGIGVCGDEAKGRSHYEKIIMFHALEMLDPDHDWHEYDWHELEGLSESRVAKMLEWRAECEAARAEVAGYNALVHLVRRACA